MRWALNFLALITLLLAPLSPAIATTDANKTVLIIRHAEPDAEQGLSSEGKARAEAYAIYFRRFALDGQPTKIGYLFAAGNTDNSQRPGLTLGPTAAALGLSIDSKYKTRQADKLARAVGKLPKGAVALISWRHSEIPDLLQSFSVDPATLLPDGRWPGKTFDWLLVLRFDADGKLLQSRRIALGSPR